MPSVHLRLLLLAVLLPILTTGIANGRIPSADAQGQWSEGADRADRAEWILPGQDGLTRFLTGPDPAPPSQVALAYVRARLRGWGLTTVDIADLVIKDQYTSQHNGVTHIVWGQRYQGFDVYGAVLQANVAGNGALINVHNRLEPDLAGRVHSLIPGISAETAVRLAATRLNLSLNEPLTVLTAAKSPDRTIYLNPAGISRQSIPARLMLVPEVDSIRLAWRLVIQETHRDHWWELLIDAVTGELVASTDWVVQEESAVHTQRLEATTSPLLASADSRAPGAVVSNAYRVYAWPFASPDAAGASHVLTVESADDVASPFGWHDTDGNDGPEYTDTRGNNVWAQEDADGDNSGGARPDGGADLLFDYAYDVSLGPTEATNQEAAVVNLFYWNNMLHDVFYLHGFNEAAGNFQVNNYGRGGLANDPIQADAQDGSGMNNANFGTPPDGQPPRMQMFIWSAPVTHLLTVSRPSGISGDYAAAGATGDAVPDRDSDLDNTVIIHEYGHGVTNRLTGGPGNSSCLNNDEQMGEGWSDFFALALTVQADDTAQAPKGIATYVTFQTPADSGIRAFPYSADMDVNPLVYDDIKAARIIQGDPSPHDVGVVWAAMLWDMFWNLVHAHGFDPDWRAGSGGNGLALQLVMDGLKLQPCHPGFIDGRDAILQADLVNNAGANQCLIWSAFVRRGLGYSADAGSSLDHSDGKQAFDWPPACARSVYTPLSRR